jgi:hypothetical protein
MKPTRNFANVRRFMVTATVLALLVGPISTVFAQRDRGVNQAGAAGNRGRDAGVNQPGATGNGAVGGSARQTRAVADPGFNQAGAAGNRAGDRGVNQPGAAGNRR